MRKTGAYKRLDNILGSLEAEVLAATDRDMLATPDTTVAQKEVRAVVHAQLAAFDAKAASAIPSEAADRRRLFELIARTRSDLPAGMRMAYGAGRKMSDREVSVLLSKLLRFGFFSKGNKG
jgi:hypothetical protein